MQHYEIFQPYFNKMIFWR